jgi:hypothetical protein
MSRGAQTAHAFPSPAGQARPGHYSLRFHLSLNRSPHLLSHTHCGYTLVTMGQTLSEPVVDKHSAHGEDDRQVSSLLTARITARTPDPRLMHSPRLSFSHHQLTLSLQISMGRERNARMAFEFVATHFFPSLLVQTNGLTR